jgi:hypothetical protein
MENTPKSNGKKRMWIVRHIQKMYGTQMLQTVFLPMPSRNNSEHIPVIVYI